MNIMEKEKKKIENLPKRNEKTMPVEKTWKRLILGSD